MPTTKKKKLKLPRQKKKSGKTVTKGFGETQDESIKTKGRKKDTLQYPQGSYVKVRDDKNDCRLCRLEQNVYSASKSIRVRWLIRCADGESYRLDYDTREKIDPMRISARVYVTEQISQKLTGPRSETVLKVSAQETMETSYAGDDADEKDSPTEPQRMKRKVNTKTKEGRQKAEEDFSKEPERKKMKMSLKRKEGKQKGRPNEKISAKDTVSKSTPTKRKIAKKKDDLTLHPNPKVTVFEEDPMFKSRKPLPFVSQYAESRLAFRAVHTGHHKLLRKLIKKGKVRELSSWRSVADQTTALHHAITLKDKESIKLLYKDFFSTDADSSKTKRLDTVIETKVNIKPLETGTSFEFQPITASRGGKEGNNALMKDLSDMEQSGTHSLSDYTDHMLKEGLDFDTMIEMLEDDDFLSCSSALRGYRTDDMYPQKYKIPAVFFYIYFSVLRNIDLAFKQGHYELAGKLLKHMAEHERFKRKIPHIFFKVLLSSSELPATSLGQATHAIKLAKRLTPLHCAACNPDTQHLKKLLNIEDINVNLSDIQDRRPLHFAAACQSTEPMALLIESGANVFLRDRQGNMPIHYAVGANRIDNVKFLIDAASKQQEKCYIRTEGHPADSREDVTGVLIHHANKHSYRPIHVAAEHGYPDMLKLLLEHGADVNSPLKLSLSKLTPLMLAAQFGFYQSAVLLVERGADVQKKDRLGRTALIHAAMNGNTNVLSYLLNIGANPNLCDNSGNSPLHYAAAYGWFFCVQCLLQAGADVNLVNNWKISPLTSAYMKTHTGIVSMILQQKNLKVNFSDDDGNLLLTTALSSTLCPELFDQVKYLVKDKGAVCDYIDGNGCSPLHHIANNDTIIDTSLKYRRPIEEAIDVSVQIAELLVEHGADIQAVSNEMNTPAMEAMIKGNLKLFKFLIEKGGVIITDPDKDGQDILYYMCTVFMFTTSDYLGILKYAASQDGTNGTQNLKRDFQKMASTYSYCDDTGFTPLVAACRRYCGFGIKCEEEFKNVYKRALQKSIYERGREFIRVLVEEFQSDVDAPVLVNKDRTAEENKQDCAGWTAVEFLASVEKCEYAGDRDENEPEWPALRMLLKYKPEVNTRDSEGCTPLECTITDNRKPATRILLSEGNADPNYCSIYGEYKIQQAFCCISHSKDADALEMLIEAGADVNAVDESDGEGLLHSTVQGKDDDEVTLKMVQLLLNNGTKVNSLCMKLRTPLHRAVEHCKGSMDDSFDVVIALMERGADLTLQDVRGRTPLHYVFVKLKKHADSSQQDPVELMRLLASRMTPDELNIQDKFGMTALHRAAFRGANICCMYLLQKGAEINIKDGQGNTPLAMAAKGLHDGCATMLIQKGADLKISVVEEEEEKADTEEKRPVWKIFTDEKKEEENQSPCLPLFKYALKKQLQGVLYMILEKPFKESGLTFIKAIKSALQLKMYNMVLRLLATSTDTAKLNQSLKHGRNLLHVLSLTATPDDTNAEKVATALIENGASITKQDAFKCTPLLYASVKRNFSLGRLYVKYPNVYDPTYTDTFDRTVLSASLWTISKEPDPKVIEWVGELLKLKANVNKLTSIQDSSKKVTPLIVAIKRQNFSLTNWMLKNGADANLADEEGIMPLMYAVCVNDLNLVKLLMDFEFNPNATDEKKAEETPNTKTSRAFQLKTKISVVSFSEDNEDMETTDEKSEITGKQFDVFKKTSKVNLNAADKNGWTVIHHVVCPLSFGTFDNDEIVFILTKAGAKLNVKNKKGETPLDLAIKNGAFKIAKMIQELEGVPEKKRVEPSILVDDTRSDISFDETRFRDDAQRYREEVGLDKDVEISFEPEINTNCEVKNGQLVKDENQDRLYNVLLAKVDSNSGMDALFNFYQMQLVKQGGKDIYVLFTRWGRIKRKGKFQHTPFNTKQEGIKEFCKIFKEKTGNRWTKVNSFTHHTCKYRMAQEGKRTGKTKTPDIDLKLKSDKESKLSNQVKTLLEELMNPESLEGAFSKTYIDKDILPLLYLDKERIEKAWNLVERISDSALNALDYMERTTKESNEKKEERLKANYQRDCEQVWLLRDDLNEVIPEAKFVFEEKRPINYHMFLEDFLSLVVKLRHYELTLRLLLAAKYREKDMNPIDYVYRSLNCHIEPLSEDAVASQCILKYIKASAPSTKVECIFSLYRRGESSRMNKRSLGDHRLLFHGGGASTIPSLLHGGLVCPPFGGNSDAKMYGKGIPFCDTFVKTSGYCNNADSTKRTNFMLLCEVALGNCKKYAERAHIRAEVEKEHNSVCFLGRSQPSSSGNVWVSSGSCRGCMIPLGMLEYNDYHNGQLTRNNYNKFAVFDESQVCLRYLIQYRMC